MLELEPNADGSRLFVVVWKPRDWDWTKARLSGAESAAFVTAEAMSVAAAAAALT